MNILKKLRLRVKAKGDTVTYKYLKKNEKHWDQLQAVPIPKFDIPEGRAIHFKHSGNIGDIIYAIPTMIALSKGQGYHLHININQPADYAAHIKHPMGNVMLTEKAFEMFKPFFLYQKDALSCDIYDTQPIDFDLDMMREYPLLRDRGNIARWYFLIFPVNFDLNKSWLKALSDSSVKDAIVIARSLRYHAPGINYKFLKQYPDIQFIGLPDEYDAMKKMIPRIKYRPVNDFLEMASIIASAKLFIGNQSSPFAIAEGLKINRLLEVCYQCPNVNVYGENGYDFCFQPQFEQLVKLRYEQF